MFDTWLWYLKQINCLKSRLVSVSNIVASKHVTTAQYLESEFAYYATVQVGPSRRL